MSEEVPKPPCFGCAESRQVFFPRLGGAQSRRSRDAEGGLAPLAEVPKLTENLDIVEVVAEQAKVFAFQQKSFDGTILPFIRRRETFDVFQMKKETKRLGALARRRPYFRKAKAKGFIGP